MLKMITGWVINNPNLHWAISKFNKELVENHWDAGSGGHHIAARQEFVAFVEGKEIVSFLIFCPWGAARSNDIALLASWTDPAYRRRGLYQTLFEAVANRYKGTGTVFVGAFHPGNEKSRQAQLKQGRTVSLFVDEWGFYKTRLELP
jgi:GNAT superfamily N-acetyltransferase